MTDTERETLCARIDELCAELSRTQLNRDMWLIRAKVTLKNLTSARAENAKLRELLSSYWKAVHCPATPNAPRDYLAEMRELGIEVNE